jgi:hypothetical protein
MPLLASMTGRLLDLPFVLAGHGYDFPGAPRHEPGGAAAGDGGIGTFPIAVVVVLALVTVGLLAWMSSPATKARLTALAPKAIAVAVIAVPLMAWSLFAGGARQGEGQTLIVERALNPAGAPELIVSLADNALNRLETTDGRRAVRLQCFRRDGRAVLDRPHRWPFVVEVGFDGPHAHQPASADQLRAVASCRLRGTSLPLEGDVRRPLDGGA